jgi:DNA-binding GntR family transcriptional regulator
MTGSKLIAGLQQVLVQFFTLVQHPSIAPADAERMCWEHRELYRAIRDRDVERARAMIRLQFRSSLIEPPAASAEGTRSSGSHADSRTSATSQ